MARLNTPRLRVTLDDGTEHDIQTTHADAVRFDVTRTRMRWPDSRDAPMLWSAFLAWAQLRARGVDLGELPEALDRIHGVEFLDAEGNPQTADTPEDDHAGVDPTTPARPPTPS